MAFARNALAAAAALALGGCAVGPDYHRPETSPPQAYRGQSSREERSVADLAWWDVCRDERLRQLVRAALTNGFDVRIAAARVAESRAAAAQVHGMLFPGVGYTANATRGRNTLLGEPYTEGAGSSADGFDGFLGAAWELDLWGRVRRLDEAARAQYLATEEGRRGVQLSLVGEVATAYYQLLELDDELAIARRETQAFGETLRLFNQQFQGGVASQLDTESARGAMAASAARIPDIERQVALQEDRLSVLVGGDPGPVARGASLEDQPDAGDLPAGLPSALLERRPDVRQAEESARAANAGIGATLGGFLPRIGLTALFGAVSPQLDTITTHGASLWSIGAGASGPLFQGGGLRGQYEQSKEAWEAAKLQYQQAALNAFADVADALVTRQKLADMRVQLQRAVDAYREAVRISTERYAAGRASYLEVIQAQQQLYPAESALARTRRDQLAAVVQLYMALGGGWNLGDDAWRGGPPG